MLRHKRTIHGGDEDELADEHNESDFDYDDGMDSDLEEHSSEKEEEEASDEEQDPWNEIIVEAFKQCQSQFEDRVKDLMDSENLDQRAARSLAFKQLRSLYRKAVINHFVEKMLWYKSIKHDRIFQATKESVKRLVEEEDYDLDEAWKYAASKRKYLFEGLLKKYLPPTVEDEEQNSDTQNENSDMEDEN